MTHVLLSVFLGQQAMADQWDADGDFDQASSDAAASKMREDAGVPGMAFAVLRNGQFIHSKGYSTEITDHCGFKHMGQFAPDYRKAMGERPSETLNRRSGG